MALAEEELFLTTQPGWAFATLAELRKRSVEGYVAFRHRDSSVTVAGGPEILSRKILTPAEVFGCVVTAEAGAGDDATEVLSARLSASVLKERVLAWLPKTLGTRRRRYSVAAETHGRTSLRRRELLEEVDGAIRRAFPRWRRGGAGGLRFYCKADPRAAILGVQLYHNLGGSEDSLPGSLRPHLACGLLTLTGVGPGDAVLDPFMGTGTVLDMATRAFGAAECIGLESETVPYRVARQRLAGTGSSLRSIRFEDFDTGMMTERTKVVSNIPFGVRFERAATDRLVRLIRDCVDRGARATLLMSRGQAKVVAGELDYRIKNVLVLGQPASIVYSGPPS